MAHKRIWHDAAGKVIHVQHRVDEGKFGAACYTDENTNYAHRNCVCSCGWVGHMSWVDEQGRTFSIVKYNTVDGVCKVKQFICPSCTGTDCITLGDPDLWFVIEDADWEDAEGYIPVEFLTVTGTGGGRRVTWDATAVAAHRQWFKDNTKGGGGRLDDLMSRIDTLTQDELNELTRIRLR